MASVELTSATFDATVREEGITFVDFWASWCGPCRSFGPIFEDAAVANPDIRFGKVDTEAEQQLSASLGIQSIPTIMAFRDGILLYAEPGALPKGAFEELITAVRGVDMDEVRRQIAEESGS